MSAEPEPQTEAIDPVGHIVRTPGVLGGRPRIAGTRIRVSDIVAQHFFHEKTPEEIAGVDVFPSITLGDVHAALAYYYDHRAEIDAEEAEDEAYVEQLKKEFSERFVDLRK